MRRASAVFVAVFLVGVFARAAAPRGLHAAAGSASAKLTRSGSTYTITVLNTATASDAPAITEFKYTPIAGFKLAQGTYCTFGHGTLDCHNLFLSAGASDAVTLASSGSPGTGPTAGSVVATFADGGTTTIPVGNDAGGTSGNAGQATADKVGHALLADERDDATLLGNLGKAISAYHRVQAKKDAAAAEAKTKSALTLAKSFEVDVSKVQLKEAEEIDGDLTETYDRITNTRLRMTVTETPHFTPGSYAPELKEAESSLKAAENLTDQVM